MRILNFTLLSGILSLLLKIEEVLVSVASLKETKLHWVKWLWRFPREQNSLWAAIIRSKFGLSLDDWSSTRFHPSSLRSPWKGISSIFSLFLPHFHHTLGDGSTIRFWLDKWVANLSLSSLFPRIFNLTTKKIGPVAIFVSNSSWNLHLGRNLRVSKIEGLSSLLLLLNSQHPHPSKVDSSTWSVSPNGLFSISSFFSALASPP